MRGAEELAKDIDKFTLESFIRYTERSGNKIIYKTECVPTDKGIPALRLHIMSTWTIREITFFKLFTHGGKFSPPDGSWTINYAGYVAETAEGMGNLIRLFDSLHAEVWAYMGAMLFVNKDAKQHNMNLLQNADDLMDNTLIALIKKLPPDVHAGLLSIFREEFDQMKKKQDEMNGKVEDTNSLIRAHVLPRPADYAVSTDDLSKILERLEIKRGKRTIERWEQYITTNGKNGVQQPDGYTLQTRLTLQSATAWATDFANKEKSKLNAKISLERLTGGRN